MTTTDKQKVIKDIQRLHEEGENIDAISEEIKHIKAKDKERIVNGKEAKVYHGIDFDNDRLLAESDEIKEYRVFVRGTSLGVFGIVDSRYYTMNRLRKSLEERNIPHYIAYQA